MTDLLSIEGTTESVSDWYYKEGWTDGLPIVAPTEEAVARFLAHTDRPDDEVIATIAPTNAEATVYLIAANAVMAGCLPEYFPVVLTAVRALAQAEYNLLAVQTTTNPITPLYLVNGPAARDLGFNGGADCLGPGVRANATVGRALRLCLVNIGGARPGPIDKSTQGQPGKYTLCFAENEAESPWEPYHVERGLDPAASAVSVFGVTGTQAIVDLSSKSALGVLKTIANSCAHVGSGSMLYGGGALLILCPEHAHMIADAGFTKREVAEFLYEHSRVRVSEFPPDVYEGVVRRRRPRRYYSHDADSTVPLADGPDDIRIVVAGGPGPHSTYCSGASEAIVPVTEAIQPADGAIVAKAGPEA
ncbi:hypothetical protein [Actinophytocola sp.]|uniref:hypothetical protein n=1 Tax=Actinophytocola sp. TaxID=1872138 RepID=UPI003D6A0B8D